ncbi:MAG: diguanylate cyclase [Spirochaetales bacterium]|jgi:diguanylate cyclase (GGDEF)-like protein|nr:diguanylate cyclase [Spirochaetales bacterium]
MPKSPPEHYDPGELENTKDNLGSISDSEARQMTEILGGEIGIERADEDLENKYQKLRELNRRKTDRILPSEQVKGRHQPISGQIEEERYSTAIEPIKKTSYFNMVKINLLSARSEYGIKTITGAFASIFSFFLPIQDYINPKFIIKGDEIFFLHIEALVLSIRSLLIQNQKHPANRLRNPLFIQILGILKDWDIEGLHQELTHLQIAPRHLTFRYCSNLAKKIYTPIIQLIDLAEGHSILYAIKRLYDLDTLSLPEKHSEMEKIKSHYNTAITEYEFIFHVLKRRCFPLLMKLSCRYFSEHNSFFLSRRGNILRFLQLSEEDILKIPGNSSQSDNLEPADVEEVPTAQERRWIEKPALHKGFEILDRLFPAAGWNKLDEFPDMYPYFRPLIMFPRGFELVPPRDPLQQIVILASVLRELYYGFRSIEFGSIQKKSTGKIGVASVIDSVIDRWRQFLDELVAQHYLSTLYEYCREVEKNAHFAVSVYGSKQKDYLVWLKKAYTLPHLVVARPRPHEAQYSVPKLSMLTAELVELFSHIARELAGSSNGKIESVQNPWQNFEFEIESKISRRFCDVLNLYHEETTNANLILYTYSILLILDSLLNDPSSFYYPYPGESLYRREDEDSQLPQHIVPALNPAAIFDEADQKVKQVERPKATSEPTIQDRLTPLLNKEGISKVIDTQISIFRQQKMPFVVLSILIRDFQEYCDNIGEESGVELLQRSANTITATVREFKDIPSRLEDALFIVLLPSTVQEESVNLAIRLFIAFQDLDDPKTRVSIGIVQFMPTWGREKLLRTARLAAKEAALIAPPSLCIYDGKQNKFQALSEAHGK